MDKLQSKIQNFATDQVSELQAGLLSNPNFSIPNLAVTSLLTGATSKLMMRSFRSGILIGIGMCYGYNRI